MKNKILSFFKSLTGTLTFLPFFLSILIVSCVLMFFITLEDCFPATLVTTDRTVIDRQMKNRNCKASMISEKLMIESEVFNDYDMPPVKTIYFFSFETDHDRIVELASIPEAVVETNPYLEAAYKFYSDNEMKMISVMFFASIVVHIVSVLIFSVWFPAVSFFDFFLRISVFVAAVIRLLIFLKGKSPILPVILVSFVGTVFFFMIFIIQRSSYVGADNKN